MLTQPDFIAQAQNIIKDTLLDHSQHAHMTVQERNENVTGNNKEIESKLVLSDQENGIFTAHIFSIILQRLVNLHGKLQKEISQRKLKELTDLQSTIAQHLKNLDREEDEEDRKEKLQINRGSKAGTYPGGRKL